MAITQEQKDLINRYASIKKDIKRLEAMADELNPQVLDLMQTNELGEIAVSDIGKLSMGSRRTWKYTNKVKQLDEALKDQKKLEEQTGDAEYSEKFYVIFKGAKED